MPNITENLYGINVNSSKYETFYDFMNDENAVKNYLSKTVSRSSDIVISHNVAMISDGNIFYIDIDCEYYEDLKNGKISGKMGDNFYDVNGEPSYSSPVRYDEANMCPYELTFTKDFRLVFDDYNCDGNADYTIKYDEDEKGSHYFISCLANDGSPRAGGQDIYMAGSFDDSIMLQKLSGESFLCWNIDDKTGKMTPVVNGEQTDKNILKNGIDKYRMYSQRYYLPENMKIYSENTSKIICYFWNNTEKDVSAGGKYYVEKLSDGTWEKVLDGKSVQNQNVKAYSFAKLAFDVADISDSEFSEYRIVMNIDDEKVYGGFFMGSKNSPKISIKPTKDNIPDNRTNINFDITNDGMFTVNLCEAELLKDGKKICNIDISSEVGDINPNTTKTLTVTDKMAGKIFAAGKYTINIKCGESKFSGTVSLINVSDENRYYFGETPIVAKTKNGYDIKIQNKIWSKTSVQILDCSPIYIFKDNKWLSTDLMYDKMSFSNYRNPEITENIPYNNELHLEYTPTLDYFVNNEEMKSFYNEFISSLDEMLKEECISQDEYQLFKDMSYEDFICYQLGFSNETISSGDLCRIAVYIGDSTEYIYFTAP